MIGLPVIGFLLLIGAIFWSLTSGLNLTGTLTARKLSGASLPAATIPWSDVDLADTDRDELKAFLEKNPEVLSSRLMTCRLIGAESGIDVRLSAVKDGEWFLVDNSTDKPLALWLKGERLRLNTLRLTRQKEALASYCRDKLSQSRGERIAIDAVTVRDDVGFTAGGGPLSSTVAAVVGDQLLPAAAEDKDGNLLFCLPAGTTSFRITGRSDRDGKKLFSGEYEVKVTGDVIAIEPEEVSAPPDTETHAETDTEPTSEPEPAQPEESTEPGTKQRDSMNDESGSNAAKKDQ